MAGVVLTMALLLGAQRAAAQCCACTGCEAPPFCVDAVANAIACAELCVQGGCDSIAFDDGDTCDGGCDGQIDLPTATTSVTVTDTPTVTPTPADTDTVTATPTVTATGEATATATATPLSSATFTPTGTATDTPEADATATGTDTPESTATITDTPEATATSTGVPTGTATATLTATAESTATATSPSGETATATATDTAGEATATETATATATATGTSAATITATATATENETAAATPTATATEPEVGTATATATPVDTGTATATATATLTGSPVVIDVGDASGRPGSTVGFAVNLNTAGHTVASAGVCIAFDPLTPIDAREDDQPDCTVSPTLGKTGTFTFEPDGCTPGGNCTGVCATVDGSGAAIADGAALFSCRVAIAANAPLADYPLVCTSPSAADADAAPLPATCNDGVVVVQNRLPGDCNGDGVVKIDELIKGVNIALERQPVTFCPAFDTNFDGKVTVDELIAAVNVALAS